jgi:lipooligosaccharide transport system permease protein
MATPPVLRVVERELRVFTRLWRGFVFSTFLAPVLFLAAMGLGLGGLVNSHTGKVAGLSYLDFVAPGLLVASGMQIAANESMWPVLGAVKWVRNFYAAVATSISPGELAVGYVLWTVVRAVMSASAFLIVAALLGAVPSAWGVLAIPASALCAAAFSAPLVAYSVGLESDVSFPVIMRVGVLPLFLFSGTFFPISQLPGWLRPFAAVSPLWHGVELARAATTGTLRLGPDIVHVAVLVACLVAGLLWSRRAFAKRLTA